MPALFYHLTRSTEEDLIRLLISRAMTQGWRVMLRGTDDAALRQIDARLWTEGEASFLPHGMEGGAHDADQPVLIGQGAAANGAQGRDPDRWRAFKSGRGQGAGTPLGAV